MDAWLAWYRPEEANLIHRLRYSNSALAPVLRERHTGLLELGIDPLMEAMGTRIAVAVVVLLILGAGFPVLLACIRSSQISWNDEKV